MILDLRSYFSFVSLGHVNYAIAHARKLQGGVGVIFLGCACLTFPMTSGSDASSGVSLTAGISPLDAVSPLLSPDAPEFFRIKHLLKST